MTRKSLPALVLAIGLLASFIHPAGAVLPAVGAVSHKNMEWRWNVPGDVASDIEFLERKLPDGSLKRYAIVGEMGHGFDLIDITNPDLPVLTSVFVDPGFNWEGDIQVNPRRNLVIVATESPGVTVGNGTSGGLAIVDISNVANPVIKSHITLTGGAHNVTIIDDQYAYGLLPTTIVDYSDASNPKNLGQVPAICGHDLTVDLNKPGIAYSACPSGQKSLQTVDISNPAQPQIIANVNNSSISIGHQADPSPDSSLIFVTDERGGGLTNETCPGGGLHVYDVSGKYVPGSSLASPKLVGHWFAPFNGAGGVSNNNGNGLWGNCTIHVHNLQSERWLMSVAHYSAGTFVADLTGPTSPAGTGLYHEFTGTAFGGPTTWGNTTGNFLAEGADTWSAKWTRFDDPKYDRYIFTSDITRGLDVFYYSGPMPKKVARLTVDNSTGGAIAGKLDRYAVYTYEGYVHKPLEGKTLRVSVDDRTIRVSTNPDGSFSAPLGLAPGTYQVEVTWLGDSEYQATSITETVAVS
jgi:hypothetical protein